jgi:hypothetical protein
MIDFLISIWTLGAALSMAVMSRRFWEMWELQWNWGDRLGLAAIYGGMCVFWPVTLYVYLKENT